MHYHLPLSLSLSKRLHYFKSSRSLSSNVWICMYETFRFRTTSRNSWKKSMLPKCVNQCVISTEIFSSNGHFRSNLKKKDHQNNVQRQIGNHSRVIARSEIQPRAEEEVPVRIIPNFQVFWMIRMPQNIHHLAQSYKTILIVQCACIPNPTDAAVLQSP